MRNLAGHHDGDDATAPRGCVLITGAAGFIGSHLTEQCLALGYEVLAVDNFTDYYDEALKHWNLASVADNPRFTLIQEDLLALDLTELVRGVSTVFHLAAQPGVRASWDQFELYTRSNVIATQRLLEAASLAPSSPRVVLASSSSVYGDAEQLPTSENAAPRPISPYGLTKVAAEQLTRVYWQSFQVPTVSVRYFSVYGPRQRPDMAFNRLISCALERRPFRIYGNGEQTRDFTFVDDAVRGTLAAAERGRPGSVYNIGGGSRRSLKSVLEILEELMNAPVAAVYKDVERGDVRDTAADISLARRELGFQPRYGLREGLRRQLEWQQARLHQTERGQPLYDWVG